MAAALREAIDEYLQNLGAGDSVALYAADDRFPLRFLGSFEKKLAEESWSLNSDPQLVIPRKIMRALFLAEKERVRKKGLKERNRAAVAAAAAAAEEETEHLTAEMIAANIAAKAASADAAASRRKAHNAASLKTNLKQKKTTIQTQSTEEFQAKIRAQQANNCAKKLATDKLKRYSTIPSKVYGKFN